MYSIIKCVYSLCELNCTLALIPAPPPSSKS